MAVFDFLNPLANVTLLFTEEQMSEIVEWFDENSKPLLIINEGPEPTNVITIEQLQQFLGLKKFHRRSFHYPSYFEIMKETEGLKAGVTRMLIKDQVIYMLNKWIKLPDMKHELKLAFKVFDTEERDFLDIDELRDIVSTYGSEPFNGNEVLEFLRDVNVRGDGNVFYNDFVESMFSTAPELHEIEKEYLYENPDEDPSLPPLPPEPEPEPEPEPVIEEPPPPPPPPPPPAKDKKGAAAKGKKK